MPSEQQEVLQQYHAPETDERRRWRFCSSWSWSSRYFRYSEQSCERVQKSNRTSRSCDERLSSVYLQKLHFEKVLVKVTCGLPPHQTKNDELFQGAFRPTNQWANPRLLRALSQWTFTLQSFGAAKLFLQLVKPDLATRSRWVTVDQPMQHNNRPELLKYTPEYFVVAQHEAVIAASKSSSHPGMSHKRNFSIQKNYTSYFTLGTDHLY